MSKYEFIFVFKLFDRQLFHNCPNSIIKLSVKVERDELETYILRYYHLLLNELSYLNYTSSYNILSIKFPTLVIYLFNQKYGN